MVVAGMLRAPNLGWRYAMAYRGHDAASPKLLACTANIGINGGLAAGQTVMHLHIHLIPRYTGDKADPRSGVRWIFPEKAAYWAMK